MRSLCLLLIGALCLLPGACAKREVKTDDVTITPVSKYKELLVGKWQNDNQEDIIQGYEFASDNTMKMTVKGMKEPVPGKFSWSGERELDITYNAGPDVKKGYVAAVNAYKEPLRKRVGKGEGPIAAGMKKGMDAIPDNLRAKETIKVTLAEKPQEVLIVNAGGRQMAFRRSK
jgi:hypothetical protein